MSIVHVPRESFEQAGVRAVCGFEFLYDPDEPEYGVCVRTDGTLPQIEHVVEAGRVGAELQRVLFKGVAPAPVSRLHQLD
jgi:hypothetical protein